MERDSYRLQAWGIEMNPCSYKMLRKDNKDINESYC